MNIYWMTVKVRENRQESWDPQLLKKKAVHSIEKLEVDKPASQRNRKKNLNYQWRGIPFCCELNDFET
jgi:hypothetical protein